MILKSCFVLFKISLLTEKRLPTTLGFVQVGLDVQTSAVCIAVLWFGLDGMLPKLLVVILYFYFFIGLQFRAGQTTMPCLHKALFVGSKQKKTSRLETFL